MAVLVQDNDRSDGDYAGINIVVGICYAHWQLQ